MLEVQNLSVTARNGAQLFEADLFSNRDRRGCGPDRAERSRQDHTAQGPARHFKRRLPGQRRYDPGGRTIAVGPVPHGNAGSCAERPWALSRKIPMTAFDPRLKLGRQMEETLRLRTGVSGKAALEQAETLLADLGLSQPRRVLDSYPAQLSGGMLQRAAAALLLALHPRYILADEPTSALDAENRTLLLELLEQQRESAGILFISHDVAALRALCGTVYVMEHGMLTEQGTMQELLEHPKQAWTKEYAAANRPVSREGWTWTD